MGRKRIALVGGGFVGICSIVQLKSAGLEPICFEKSDKYGGTWCYREESKIGQASIMPTTIVNQSKEIGSLSNFPVSKEMPNFMSHSQLYQVVKEYAEPYDFEKHIQFNTEVVLIKKAEDYDETGRWSVTSKNVITGYISTQTYDGVFIGTGHFTEPNIPVYTDQDIFTGEIMHTHSLKGVERFKGQNVVVVGMGCSALDAAVDISRVAKQVYLSTRNGAFVFSRVGRNGYPTDYFWARRYIAFFQSILPANLCSWYVETFYLDPVFDHRLYYIKPKYHMLSKDPVINDHIFSLLLSGRVIQKGNIHHFTANGVVFESDEEIADVDTVIMGTGYKWSFPFLDDGLLVTEADGRISLYKCIYPVQLPHPTLAFIGFINPFGPGFPIGEMQIRWATYNLANNVKLPSEELMLKDVIKRHTANVKRYSPSSITTVRVDYMLYLDELAEQFGVKPNLWKYMLTDIPLFVKLVFGPFLPCQYRLEGPGKWEGAREAIMTCEERIQYPLLRKTPYKKGIFQCVIEYIVNLMPFNFYVIHY